MRFYQIGDGDRPHAAESYADARHAHNKLALDEQHHQQALAKLRETGAGWEPYRATAAPNVHLHTKVRTRTGTLKSAFTSNDGVHLYESAVLAMRQRIIREAVRSKLVLPARFENAGPNTIRGIFLGMLQRGYFGDAR